MIRTLVVATLAVWTGRTVLKQLMQCRHSSWRRVWLFALLIPLLVPELIVGFTYRLTAQHLTHSVWDTEFLYGAALFIRSCSVSVIVHLLLPDGPVTPESIHSWKLLRGRGKFDRWNQLRLLVTGPRRSAVAACAFTMAAGSCGSLPLVYLGRDHGIHPASRER